MTASQQNGGQLMSDPRVVRLGYALQVVMQGIRGGEGVCHGTLSPLLAKLLPLLLRVQVGRLTLSISWL